MDRGQTRRGVEQNGKTENAFTTEGQARILRMDTENTIHIRKTEKLVTSNFKTPALRNALSGGQKPQPGSRPGSHTPMREHLASGA